MHPAFFCLARPSPPRSLMFGSCLPFYFPIRWCGPFFFNTVPPLFGVVFFISPCFGQKCLLPPPSVGPRATGGSARKYHPVFLSPPLTCSQLFGWLPLSLVAPGWESPRGGLARSLALMEHAAVPFFVPFFFIPAFRSPWSGWL